MNQGNHNLDIRIPEMSEDLTTKKKSKLALVLSLSAIGIIIIAAAIIKMGRRKVFNQHL